MAAKTPEVFVQFKNTDICIDFWCKCGAEGHYDGYFASNVQCPSCGETFSLPHTLQLGSANPEAPTVIVELDEEHATS